MSDLTVWVGLYDHKHGTDVGVYDSEDAAYAHMADYIRRNLWAHAFDVIANSDPKILPAKPPASDVECVNAYFAVMGDEFEPETFLVEHQPVRSQGELDVGDCPRCGGWKTNASGTGREGQEVRYCEDCEQHYQSFTFEEGP